MMNLKYYLRGLGIGVVVTALIMGILAGKKEVLSDEEVIERAKALGMTQESVLLADTLASYEEEAQEELEGGGVPSKVDQQPADQDGSDTQESEKVQEPLEEGDTQQQPEEDAQQVQQEEDTQPEQEPEAVTEPEQESAEEKEAETAQEVPAEESGGGASGEASASESEPASDTEEGNFTIEIKSGDSSYSVCQRLEEAGLVETATAFDRYLYENGYDKRINTGVFEIPRDADMEKIAKIISRMN